MAKGAAMLVERDAEVPMRDGTVLRADVYRPVAAERSPVLMMRTAYGKREPGSVSTFMFDPGDAVDRGYAVVVQDVRGRGESEGDFHPIVQERTDGHDSIGWAAGTSWSNGRVGLYGSSYMGVCAVQASVDAPPGLRAIAAYATAASFRDVWAYVGDAFELAFNVRWSMRAAAALLRRDGPGAGPDRGGDPRQDTRHAVRSFEDDHLGYYRSKPDPRALVAPLAPVVPHVVDFLDRAGDVDYWDRIDVTGQANRVTVPVLGIAGWQDGFLKSGIDLFRALGERGPAALRAAHRLIIGPWDHNSYLSSQTLDMAGARRFGPAAAGGRVGLRGIVLDWFDGWLGDQPAGTAAPRVRYYHVGPNQWRDGAHWPPRIATDVALFLGAGRRSPAPAAGTLGAEPGSTGRHRFHHDPDDPVPTVSGRHLAYEVGSGFQDQEPVHRRGDVLVYTSEPLRGDLEVLGNVHATVTYRATAPSIDLVLTLCDVDTDGRTANVADGVRRTPPRRPRTVAAAEIDLWDVAYTFRAGHRIRLIVAGSSFPRFDVNRSGGRTPAGIDVLHGAGHPSRVVLPVLGGAR